MRSDSHADAKLLLRFQTGENVRAITYGWRNSSSYILKCAKARWSTLSVIVLAGMTGGLRTRATMIEEQPI